MCCSYEVVLTESFSILRNHRTYHRILALMKAERKDKAMLRPMVCLVSGLHLGPKTRVLLRLVAGLLIRGALSDERTCRSYTGFRQYSHIYCLWSLAAILLHEFWRNFCDGHYSVFFWLGPSELSWFAEISLRLLWTCSDTNCWH
jgi:hypothetical protein